MKKFAADLSNVESLVYKKSFKLEDVKDKIEKIGFDIVKFRDNDNGANLWKIQQEEDGSYIVALYSQEEENIKTADWSVHLSKIGSNIQVSYKGDPLVSINTSKLGIKEDQLKNIPSYLPERLAENKRLVKALLNQMPKSAKELALKKYPELGSV